MSLLRWVLTDPNATRGVAIVAWSRVSHAPAFHVPDVADTTGAGDSFASGFITGLLEGMEMGKCLVRGNACAALAIRKVGAREAMPTGEELKEFLRNVEL